MSSDKIDSTEVGGFWDKLFYLIKLITGDVKVSTKGTLQNQIDEMSTKVDDCFTSVSDGKKAVASAITDKGVTTAQDAEFATMAANVRKIKTNPTLQTKTVTLDTSNTTQTLTPDPGYDGLSQVKASITTQTKSVNLSTSQQVVKPDSGKVLSQVTVPAVTGSAGLKDVVTGKTFNSATAGVGKTGTLPDKRGTTVDAATVNQDDNYTYFTVPTEAVYDAKSKLRTLSSNLGNLVYKLNVQLSSITTREPAGEWSSNIRYGYKTDISKVYPFYKRLSSDNFIIELLGGSGSSSVGNGGAQNAGNSTLTKSYDADTGILTIDGTGHYHSYDGSSGSYNTAICVYLVLSNVKELP